MKIKKNIPIFITKKSSLAVILIAGLGIAMVWYTIGETKQKMRKNLLQKALIAASSINTEGLRSLTGKESDVHNQYYQRIKNQLKTIRQNYSDCRFLYIMQEKSNGQVMFLVDAQLPSSPDYAKPGLIYKEISEEYLQVFKSEQRATVGPITDRWGTLMTALIPIKPSPQDEAIAVLGMDVAIKDWNLTVLKRLLPLIIIVFVAVMLVFYIQQVRLLRKDREARDRIRRSQQQYKALFDHAADGIITGNIKGEITKANHSFCMITGYEEHEIVGQKVDFLFSPKVLEDKPLDYKKLLQGETIKQERDMIKKSGEHIVVEMHSKKIDEETLQSFFRDITRRKRNEKTIQEKNSELMAAEEELRTSNEELRTTNALLEQQKLELAEAKRKAEESDRLKSNFLANMSHEVRTPMNAIIGFSELILESEQLKNSDAEPYLETIIKQANHLLQLINDIVDLSKIEADQIAINIRKVCINELIDELQVAFSMHRLNTEHVQIKSHKALPDRESWIMTDELRLKQIFNNLISNALKFTREGIIEFGYTLTRENNMQFFVKDTGIGIPKEKQVLIFERFHRLHDGHTSHYEGTGLGLSISKSLVELLGGSIMVESEPEKGTEFIFKIRQS